MLDCAHTIIVWKDFCYFDFMDIYVAAVWCCYSNGSWMSSLLEVACLFVWINQYILTLMFENFLKRVPVWRVLRYLHQDCLEMVQPNIVWLMTDCLASNCKAFVSWIFEHYGTWKDEVRICKFLALMLLCISSCLVVELTRPLLAFALVFNQPHFGDVLILWDSENLWLSCSHFIYVIVLENWMKLSIKVLLLPQNSHPN